MVWQVAYYCNTTSCLMKTVGDTAEIADCYLRVQERSVLLADIRVSHQFRRTVRWQRHWWKIKTSLTCLNNIFIFCIIIKKFKLIFPLPYRHYNKNNLKCVTLKKFYIFIIIKLEQTKERKILTDMHYTWTKYEDNIGIILHLFKK